MTRYARANGSKSSNKKFAQQATPWKTLKRKIDSSTKDVEESEPEKNDEELEVNKPYKRRKPMEDIPPIYVYGIETHIARFEGFPVKKEDAERLKALRKDLMSQGVPRSEVKKVLKNERRKAEKVLSRDRKKVCFHCRFSGHVLSECPELGDADHENSANSGICFKCGSTEHTHTQCRSVRDDNYKYATCFICKEEGHISKQCPDNPRGLYPQGGACKLCGDVTHMKRDCPRTKKQEFEPALKTLDTRAPESLDDDFRKKTTQKCQKRMKFIKMNKK